ncbi:DUF4435 domain-containing protein [Spartinivicinus poritis]|uniref:DUF4435 domain-containing protein n=1 Tax=Spartinivicinus poritis TaxID=2994640 RepID=A0ABT5U6W7_9GAMM|nr:DUF4435 domain-containing protein [Spartinivicinus sp. A2-2]MDE1460919.1 DUF4435 domain-containing protein [Spartinivicinus sp. A2-2]
MIPERSDVAKSAKSVFFEDVNDIDIYIEDTATGYAKLYSIIFTRVFEGVYRVEEVFPIGDRKSVIKRHECHCSTERPSIYIVDGDLFILAGDEVENKPGLFRLPLYCIENLLCDHEAILDVLDEEEPVITREKIADQFDYDGWVVNNCDLLFQIFIEYSISFKIDPTVQTVSYPVKDFVEANTGDLSGVKISERINALRLNSVSKVGEEQYLFIKNEMLSQFGGDPQEKLSIVSGKDYLFPLLKMRAKSTVKTQIPDINFKQRIAKRCDIEPLSQVGDYVLC